MRAITAPSNKMESTSGLPSWEFESFSKIDVKVDFVPERVTPYCDREGGYGWFS